MRHRQLKRGRTSWCNESCYETFLGAAFSSIIIKLCFNSQIRRFVVGWELGMSQAVTVITITNSFYGLSYDKSIDVYKQNSPQSAVWCFLLQYTVPSLFLKVIQ